MSMIVGAGTIIVGGGHAGAQAAIALRQNGYSGPVTIIGREQLLPYERPPLSKEYMSGEKEFERLYIRPRAFWDEKQVQLVLGRTVEVVEPVGKTVKLDDGSSRVYNSLIWAAGGDPRMLAISGADLLGVHHVRTRLDVDSILTELPRVNKVVVIGGGYIGLEAAAALSKMSKEVVLLEALPRVLARVAGPELSRFFEAEHRAHGVDLRTSVVVDAFEGNDCRMTGVRLGDGSVIEAQMAIVGIGISPTVGPLDVAGAKIANGVKVDEYCRTSLKDIYAIGDCAAHANAFAGGATIRLESVQNANDQANVVAKVICASDPKPYNMTPWFWSSQYDLKLQTVGLSAGYDATVLRGNPITRSFSVIYLKEGKVIALDCVNMVKDYVQGRKIVELGAVIAKEKLRDTSSALKDLIEV